MLKLVTFIKLTSINSLAPPVSGVIPNGAQASAGIVQAVELFQMNTAAGLISGAFYIISFGLWAIETSLCVYLYIQVNMEICNG